MSCTLEVDGTGCVKPSAHLEWQWRWKSTACTLLCNISVSQVDSALYIYVHDVLDAMSLLHKVHLTLKLPSAEMTTAERWDNGGELLHVITVTIWTDEMSVQSLPTSHTGTSCTLGFYEL